MGSTAARSGAACRRGVAGDAPTEPLADGSASSTESAVLERFAAGCSTAVAGADDAALVIFGAIAGYGRWDAPPKGGHRNERLRVRPHTGDAWPVHMYHGTGRWPVDAGRMTLADDRRSGAVCCRSSVIGPQSEVLGPSVPGHGPTARPQLRRVREHGPPPDRQRTHHARRHRPQSCTTTRGTQPSHSTAFRGPWHTTVLTSTTTARRYSATHYTHHTHYGCGPHVRDHPPLLSVVDGWIPSCCHGLAVRVQCRPVRCIRPPVRGHRPDVGGQCTLPVLT